MCIGGVYINAREIHAYRNEDGTYHIEMLCNTENLQETKVEIHRADMKILAYSVALGEPTIFTLDVKDGE